MSARPHPLVVQMAALPVDADYKPPVAVEIVRLWEQADIDAWLASHRGDIAVLITHSAIAVDAAFVDAMPNLGLIANFGVGLDMIDTAAARSRGVRITHTPDMLTNDVADLAIALMLCCLRNVPDGHARVASGQWPDVPGPLGQSARGRRLGVFGLGRIGREVARLGTAFGMEVGYASRRAKPDVPYPAFASCRDLAEWCDVLILCVAGTEHTTNVVDANVLNALGPGGILVNVARGTLVDEHALTAALHEGRIGGAGLDVYRPARVVDPALRSAPNIVLSPYVGSATVQTRRAMADSVWHNVAWFLEGRAIEREFAG